MPKKKKKEDKELPKVHDNLKGFKLDINQFGEIKSSFHVEKLNDFLNEEVDDKKLRDRTDLDFTPKRNDDPKKDKS